LDGSRFASSALIPSAQTAIPFTFATGSIPPQNERGIVASHLASAPRSITLGN
jgi:hypothetical protein